MWTKWLIPLLTPLLAGGVIITGLFWAHESGKKVERKIWEARQKDAQIDSLKAYTEELKTAASVGQSIANALYAAAIARAQIQTHTQTIVKEVERENAALPNADTCIMPDAVVRLRDEQVRDSAKSEADARDYIRKRLDAVPKVNSR